MNMMYHTLSKKFKKCVLVKTIVYYFVVIRPSHHLTRYRFTSIDAVRVLCPKPTYDTRSKVAMLLTWNKRKSGINSRKLSKRNEGNVLGGRTFVMGYFSSLRRD